MKSLLVGEAIGLVCLKLFIYSTLQSSLVTSLAVNVSMELNFLQKPSLICGSDKAGCTPTLTSASSLLSKQVTEGTGLVIIDDNIVQVLPVIYSVSTDQLDIIPLVETFASTLVLQCPSSTPCNGETYVGNSADTIKLFRIFDNSSLSRPLTFEGLESSILKVTANVTYIYWPDPVNSLNCLNGFADGKCPAEAKFFCPIFADSVVPVPCCPVNVDDSCIGSIETTTVTTSTVTPTSSNITISTTMPSSTSTIVSGTSSSSTSSGTEPSDFIGNTTTAVDATTAINSTVTLATDSSTVSKEDSTSLSSFETTHFTTKTPDWPTSPSDCPEDSSYKIVAITLAVITGVLLVAVITVSVLLVRLRKKVLNSLPTVDSTGEVDGQNYDYPRRKPNYYDTA